MRLNREQLMGMSRTTEYRGYQIETTARGGIVDGHFSGFARVTLDNLFIVDLVTKDRYLNYRIADEAVLQQGVGFVDRELDKV